MGNVYERIRKFFAGVLDSDNLSFGQSATEKFFRREAWQGKTDEELLKEWQAVSALIKYMYRAKVLDTDRLETDEWQEIVYRAAGGEDITADDVSFFLDTLENFCRSASDVAQDKLAKNMAIVRDKFFPRGKFNPAPRPPEENFYSPTFDAMNIENEDLDRINACMNFLLQRIDYYRRSASGTKEIKRAFLLYEGKSDDGSAGYKISKQQDVNDGFWDYFLFDYHLSREDISPLRWFVRLEGANLSVTERGIISVLLRSKYKIVYPEYVEEEYAVCRDLFTDEIIEMVVPEPPVGDFRRYLFGAHVNNRGLLLHSYVSEYPVSLKLRRRVKRELLRLYEMYRQQWATATLEDFLARHTAAVHHVLKILSSQARLNVVPHFEISPPIETPAGLRTEFAAAVKRLAGMAESHGVVGYAQKILLKLYEDYLACSKVSAAKKRRSETLLTAIYALHVVNFGVSNPERYVKINAANKDAIAKCYGDFEMSLNLKPYDPRYLTEEGMILSLYRVPLP